MNYLCVRLAEQTQERESCDWALLDDQGALISEGCHALTDLKEHVWTAETRLIALVAGSRVLTTEVEVEAQHASHVRKVIPYLVEEQLAEDLDDVHIAVSPNAGTGLNHVAVVGHAELVHWLDQLYMADLAPYLITPDYLNLPETGPGARVLFEQGNAVIQFGRYHGTIIEPENLANYLDLHFAQSGSQKVLGGENAAADGVHVALMAQEKDATGRALMERFQYELAHLNVDCQIFVESPIVLQATTAVRSISDSLNLLQGGYRIQEREKSLIPWNSMVAAAALFVFAELGLFATSSWWFSKEGESKQEASIAQYLEVFPDEQRVFDPRRQFQSHLKRANGNSSSGEFMYLLERASLAMNGSSMPVKSLRYDAFGQGLELELETDSLDQLEAYTSRLKQNNRITVELLSAVEDSGRVNGRVRVELI